VVIFSARRIRFQDRIRHFLPKSNLTPLLIGVSVPQFQSIDITDLELDLTNYRIKRQPDQRATIRELILIQGDKLANLAKDIVLIGLSPFDLTMVTASVGDPRLYTVLEGNRRVAALKCLHEPELARDTSEHRRFIDLNKEYEDVAPYEITCSVVPSKEEALEFIRRKHDTGMDGRGTETWTAVMKERAAADQGRGTPTHHALEFVLKNAKLDPEVKEKVEGHKFPITTLRRILESTAKVKTTLGFESDEKARSFATTADKNWVLGVLTEMVTIVATGKRNGQDFTVRDIIEKSQREQFLGEVLKNQPKPPAKGTQWHINASTEIETSIPLLTTARIRINPHTLDRKFLIPADFKIKIPNGKANDIYVELRSRLEVKRCPNAAAVLMRVFIEFAAESYLNRHKGIQVKTTQKMGPSLAEKLKAITKDMEDKGTLEKKAMTKITQLVSNRNSLVSAYTLNQYVHSAELTPGPNELKASWTSIQLFIEKCWNA
jgi:hypothetical protein